MASVTEVMKMATKVLKLQQRKNAEELELKKIEATRKQMDRKARTRKLIIIGSILVAEIKKRNGKNLLEIDENFYPEIISGLIKSSI